MKVKILAYIFATLLTLPLWSCRDDIIYTEETGDLPPTGYIMLDLSAGGGDMRTRHIDMSEKATVRVNNVWVGVYDVATGKRVGQGIVEDFNKIYTAGTVHKGQLRVGVNIGYNQPSNPEVCIVGVANYDGVVTWNGDGNGGQSLLDMLQGANTWVSLMELDIDAASAYAGDKGEAYEASAPLLMGYYFLADNLIAAPKYNQFTGGDAINMYPPSAMASMRVRLNGSIYEADHRDNLYYVPAGALVLRRFVSNINVNLVPAEGITISDVRYMKFNEPQAVYLAQRRMDTTPRNSHYEWQRMSPNFADLFVESDGTVLHNVYKNTEETEDWQQANSTSFSFQHFENKHWGFGAIDGFSDRENRADNGLFTALCPNEDYAFNNYASYFKIRMRVTDTRDGKNNTGEVEYTIHEGFCNNENGQASEGSERNYDFASFRNTDYTYTLSVNGVDNIVLNASSKPGDHINGQAGDIWKYIYVNDLQDQIPQEGGTFGDMTFDSGSDIGFRFYWEDISGTHHDYYYNVSKDILNSATLENLWPEIDGNTRNVTAVPAAIDAIFRITDGTREYTLSEFLALKGSYSSSARYQIKIGEYATNEQINGNPRAFMRALYLIDNSKSRQDRDGCSKYSMIYIAEQYPVTVWPVFKLVASDMRYDSSFYDYAFNNKWTGSQYSRVYLAWKHYEECLGYKVEIDGKTYTIDNPADYQETLGGETIIRYPIITNGFAAMTYDMTITPMVDNKRYQAEPLTLYGALDIIEPTWSVPSTPGLKDLDVSGKSNFTSYYYGFEYLHLDTSKASASRKGQYISFGGAANLSNRIMRIYATKSGEFHNVARSNSTNGKEDRHAVIMVVYEDQLEEIPPGQLLTTIRDQYPDQYWISSGALDSSTTQTKYSDKHWHMNLKRPAYVYFLNDANDVRFQTFRFEPD